MAKPPPDTDPEKFVIGNGAYSDMRIARPYGDEHVFRIEPMPPPFRSCLVTGLIFAVACVSFYAIRMHLPPDVAVDPCLILAGLAFSVSFVFGLRAVGVCGELLAIRNVGPCLIYDKSSGRVELPWEGEVFKRDEIVHVQYITTKRLDGIDSEQLSELNLITQRRGRRQRWPLLRSINNIKAFDYIVKPLIEHTGLTVLRVEDQGRGWQVTEKPYA